MNGEVWFIDWLRPLSMAYDLQQIADAVHKRLRDHPRTPLGVISRDLGVERHTITRAVISHFGMTFRDMARKCVLERASALRDRHRPLSAKELSFAVGYRSAESLSRLVRLSRPRNLA